MAACICDPEADGGTDICLRLAWRNAGARMAILSGVAGLLALLHRRKAPGFRSAWLAWWRGRIRHPLASHVAYIRIGLLLASVALALGGNYHVLGTDRTGNDVLWQCLKSMRTALVIGSADHHGHAAARTGFRHCRGLFQRPGR